MSFIFGSSAVHVQHHPHPPPRLHVITSGQTRLLGLDMWPSRDFVKSDIAASLQIHSLCETAYVEGVLVVIQVSLAETYNDNLLHVEPHGTGVPRS